jgi:hypothetical protein
MGWPVVSGDRLAGQTLTPRAYHGCRGIPSRKEGKCAGATALLAKCIPFLRRGVVSHPDLQLSDFIQALEQLGSEKDWCSSGKVTQKLPRIAREYACCEPHAEGLIG